MQQVKHVRGWGRIWTLSFTSSLVALGLKPLAALAGQIESKKMNRIEALKPNPD